MSAELTQAERDYFRANLRQNLGYQAWVIENTMLAHVEKILSDRLARVEALIEQGGVRTLDDFDEPCVMLGDLRDALAPAPTEAANGRQIGSDERVGTKEDA